MKQTLQSFICVLFALLCVLPCVAQEPPFGFEALFNGKDFQGWTGGTTRNPEEIKRLPADQAEAWRSKMDAGVKAHWRVEDGQLVSDGQEPHLVTERDYGDFELWVDWKLSANGDSGIYLRGCPQVQIWDPTNKSDHPHGADKGSGGLWNNQKKGRDPSVLADKPIGEWNRMVVRMVGPYVTVKLNDKTVVENTPLENYYDRSKPVPMTGPIHLQTHGSETRFRNLFIREIDAEESTKLLAEIRGDEQDFAPLFNGKDLTGWQGGTHGYEVVDGVLLSKGIHGANLITKKTYSDFIVRCAFKLPKGGNNGLIIRTPSAEVVPAEHAIEVQILDDTAPNHADLKPYQYHGSIYGIQPAIRGYLRPVGQWNDQEVRVVGDHITVTLNGFTIVDAHLDDIAPNHKGAQRRSGYFGFNGHDGKVAFRDIRIKELNTQAPDPTQEQE